MFCQRIQRIPGKSMIFSHNYSRYHACFGKKITENRQKSLGNTHFILYTIMYT